MRILKSSDKIGCVTWYHVTLLPQVSGLTLNLKPSRNFAKIGIVSRD